MKRLLGYLKPHKWVMTAATLLVLFIIVVELYRPIIIGDAIDNYINGYYRPYYVTEEGTPETVRYGELYLARVPLESTGDTGDGGAGAHANDNTSADGISTDSISANGISSDVSYYQILLYQDRYYMAENLTWEETRLLADADNDTLQTYAETRSRLLDSDDLKELRRFDFSGILKAAALYLLMLFVGFALNAADTWMLQRMGQNIIYRMREEVFGHIHSLSLNFFNTTPVGKLVTRVSNDTEAVNELFTTILVKLFKNIVKIIGYAVVMISINAGMALVSFLLLPVVTVLTFFFRYMSRKAYQITRNKITELNTFLSEHISGMKLIQIFAREEEKYEEFKQKSHELFRANWREVMTFAIFRPSIYLISILAMIIVIGTGSSYVLNGTLSLGTLFIFISYISSFFEPIQELAEQFGTLQSSLASAEKIFSILDEQPEIVSPDKPVSVQIQGRIEFKHVWFAYEKDDYILKDVSFIIQPGEKVAFVGATGAGKTSILNLIGRYFDIQKGEILIDGVNIKDIDTNVLRGAIGQVQQDVFLFTGDIKSNISLGNENITLEDVKAAAHTVHADTFIEKMPESYDAPVTERGSTLSAGQRQLISFARTLAYKPTILVLDEATANIDTETESLITQALSTLMEGRTTIMVAHRLSTIQHADKIIVMHKGRIKEAGSHQELLAQNGLYKKLYDLQLVES
ncbi:MAG: ABC transporter ATP-binding protein [Lachnospiraceae bacterium]|nr:ABC transporter ATP-binding protein [Lachnospiraceae bacterium]